MEESDDDGDYQKRRKGRRRRKKKYKDPLYQRYLDGDPTVGPLGEGTGRYEFIVEYSSKKKEPEPEIMMINPPQDFPPFEDFTRDNVYHCPKIVTTTINPSGPEQISQGEKVLNWQTENAVAQNQLLRSINRKVDQMANDYSKRQTSLQSAIFEINARLENLHQEMMTMAQNMMVNTSHFRNKEVEMTSLRNQLRDLQKSLDSMQQQRRPSSDSFFPAFEDLAPKYSAFHGSYSPGFLSQDSSQPRRTPAPGFLSSDAAFTSRYGMPSFEEFTPRPRREKIRRHKDPELFTQPLRKQAILTPSQSSQESQGEEKKDEKLKGVAQDINIIEFSMTSLLENLADQVKTVQEPTRRETIHTSQELKLPTIAHISDSSSEDSRSEVESLPKQFVINDASGSRTKQEPDVNVVFTSDDEMDNQPFRDQPFREQGGPARPFASKIMTFTFDDIPFEKWNDRLDEFHAWMTSEALASPTHTVIQQFTARLSGALREWWNSLGDYRQRQVFQTTIPMLLGEIHREFIGTPNHLKDQLQEEYFTAKCCSLKKRDLAKHFERQTRRYYALDGLNNPSLKHVYLSSIDDYLSQQTKLYIRDQGQTVEEISIGQIQQYVFRTLDKLCKQKEFWTEFMNKSKHLSKICSRPDLSIKCSKQKKSCSCNGHKKSYRSSRRFKKEFSRFRRRRFFRKKRSFKKSTKCYLCHKEGHFAKNCPNKSRKKKQYLINSISNIAPELDLDKHDIESVLSYDSDEQDAICRYSDSEDSSDVSSDDEDCCYRISRMPQQEDVHTPHLPITIYDPSQETDPLKAIAFIDTGAHTTIMNPKILPPSMWLPYEQEFRVANAGTLVIKLKSKPIIIEIFPGCQITTEVLGSTAPGKDLILGWDSYHLLKKQYDISIEPRGVKWRSQFKPFTTIPRFYSIESSMAITFDDIKEEIAEVSCADSHNEFLQKCKNPLWLNPAFFVSLPFKENVVTTPTKASHAGMTPSLLQQANEECDQLVSQGIVSQTNSPWACKAFYVNNRAEQARGKLRLVIDYKPLNQYLQDIKFPLPSRRSLLQHLSGAKIFSKFDLKSGFWQLGVQPEERYKTAFCLPNRHLEWKVLPFGLKTAPSLFQQAMLRIFKPLIHTALIYIDDILLFSNNEAEHMKTLRQFQDIVKEYGIMLSARKMIIAKPSIEFLGVQITDGQFAPQAHLATELLDFPEENLTRRQVQQFLGVINYLSDFVPKLSELTNPLRKMLKKNPPQWSPRQTEAVKRLKIEIQKLPPLKIPSTGKRIIQTDASDKYWGAILFEETDGKRQICGYRSGRFKDSEMHYHSTFKEILAVKRAIEKFEFHLIGHKFRIEMDMSSFPKMLQFKQKTVPHQQLLRWSEWFSKYEFESAYLKGTRNVLADMLSQNPVKNIHI